MIIEQECSFDQGSVCITIGNRLLEILDFDP